MRLLNSCDILEKLQPACSIISAKQTVQRKKRARRQKEAVRGGL